MTIRPAKSQDIAFLAEYWYDQMALLAQKNPAIRLAPNAQKQWESFAHSALSKAWFLVAEHDGEIFGGIIGTKLDNAIGLEPKQVGQIRYLILDMHSPKTQYNTASALVQALLERFKEAGLSQCRITVAAQAHVEQGFWRGLGANLLEETFWMAL